jgi:hypothetical protein
MFLISKTYQTVSPESADYGEYEDSGYCWENTECSFSEIVDTIRGLEPSQSPITNPAFVWFTEHGDTNYNTGEETNYSYHYSRDNKQGNLKHWVKAIKAAGFKIVD